MESIIFLAQFWGWFMALAGVMLLFGGVTFVRELTELVSKDRGFVILAGFFALVLGLATLILHRTWSSDWSGVVTALGWLAVIAGIIRIMMPKVVRYVLGWFNNNVLILYSVAFFCIALGIGLIRFGGSNY